MTWIHKKIRSARTIGNAYFLYSANIKFEIYKKRHGYPKKLKLEPLFVYSKEVLLERHHQMFCINSETVRFQLTSRLTNGRFEPSITRTIDNAFYLYSANIKFEIYKKRHGYTKKLKLEPVFVYSKQALLEQQYQMFCFNYETVRFQLTSRFRNGRFQPIITRTFGNAFFSYSANIKFEIHKKRHWYSKKLKVQEQLLMHSFYIIQNIKFELHKKNTWILKKIIIGATFCVQ